MRCNESLVPLAALMLTILLVDLSCGPEITPWVVYTVPIVLVSRFCGFSMGVAYSVIAGGLLLLAARHSGHPYSAEGYLLIAVAWKTVALIVIAWLTARLSSLERLLRSLTVYREPKRQ